MKILKIKFAWIAWFFMLVLANLVSGQSTYHVSFFENTFESKTRIEEDKKEYEEITMKGLKNSGEPGQPSLPVRYIQLIIPPDQDVTGINISASSETEQTLMKKIIPAQPDMPTMLIESKAAFVEPLDDIYNSDQPFPEKMIKVVDEGYFDGANHIVMLAITPVQYQPKSNMLILYSSIDFSFEFGPAQGEPIIVNNRKKNVQKMYDNILQGMVYNQNEIPLYKARHNLVQENKDKNLNKLTKTNSGIDYYEYVIITDDYLKDSFDRFVNWKKRKGLDIGVVTTSEIAAAYFDTDLISSIPPDVPGGIRQYLYMGYRDHGTVWVLMGGDSSHAPVRYGCGYKNSWDYRDPLTDKIIAYGADKIPADIYFAEFNGDWNGDDDIYYGEDDGDDPGYGQEIYIGRVLAETPEDVEKWTDKVLLYEQNPGKGDCSYLTRSFTIQSDQAQQDNKGRNSAAHLPAAFDTLIWEENGYHEGWDDASPTFPYGYDAINQMNSARYGLWSWFGHGSPICYICKSDSICTNPMSSIKPWSGMDGESGNGLDNLSNKDYPAIVYSVACTNTPFDDYETASGHRNLGEAFTCIFEGGGPAFLGNTRLGWHNRSPALYQLFANKIAQADSNMHIGIAEANSKMLLGTPKHRVCYSYNLVGCPETMIWTNTPQSFTSVSSTVQYIYVTINAGESGCNITAMSIDDGDSYYNNSRNVSSIQIVHSVNDIAKYITITKPNFLPYIALYGGEIEEDFEIDESKLILMSDLVVTDGATLTIAPGTRLCMASGVSITVDSGSEIVADNVIFTSTGSTSPSAWTGLVIEGEADIDDCTFEYANKGVHFQQGSSGSVNNSVFSDCNNGVYVYKAKPGVGANDFDDCSTGLYISDNIDVAGRMTIADNDFDDCDYGIQCYRSSPLIAGNHLTDGTIGVYCITYSSPLALCNIIENFSDGLRAFDSSSPNFGTGGTGYNSIKSNSSHHVFANINSHVSAENNWWGTSPPNSSKFLALYASTIDYSPYLYSDPNPAKSIATEEDGTLDESPLTELESQVMEARILAWNGDIDKAQTICKSIIKEHPTESEAIFALETLYMTSGLEEAKPDQNLSSFKQYIKNLKPIEQTELHGHISLITGLDETSKITANMDAVYNKFKDSYIGASALYTKFHDAWFQQNDKETAVTIYQKMVSEYASSEYTFAAYHDLYRKSSEYEKLDKDYTNTIEIPEEFFLSQNYPNPFNPSTTIHYALPKTSSVQATIYNMLGQQVKSFAFEAQKPGTHSLVWDGMNEAGIQVSGGMYIIHFKAEACEEKAESFEKSMKMMLLK